jgi:hypothetical protein
MIQACYFSGFDSNINCLISDTLNSDQEHGQAIKLKLSTNNDLKSHPDTPQHHFKKVINSLIDSKGSQDYRTTYAFATTLAAGNQLDVKTLLQKYKDIVEFFCDIYQFRIFRAKSYHPKQLVASKKTVWGVSAIAFG